MRHTKYRAYDNVAKTFLKPWPEGFHILGEVTCFDLIGQQLKERNPDKTVLEMLNDIEITEWTGLTDKNGKEIWEGDIVGRVYEWSPQIRYINQVIFHKGQFGLEPHVNRVVRPAFRAQHATFQYRRKCPRCQRRWLVDIRPIAALRDGGGWIHNATWSPVIASWGDVLGEENV